MVFEPLCLLISALLTIYHTYKMKNYVCVAIVWGICDMQELKSFFFLNKKAHSVHNFPGLLAYLIIISERLRRWWDSCLSLWSTKLYRGRERNFDDVVKEVMLIAGEKGRFTALKDLRQCPVLRIKLEVTYAFLNWRR